MGERGGQVRRYVPQWDFPCYAHRLGLTAHPRRDEGGHSYGQAEFCAPAGLRPDNWRASRLYLWGVDLFNNAFWWEAHEAWEALWKCSAPLVREFLQGLIQIGAACLKAAAGNRVGTERLLDKGRRRLERVCGETGVFMGVELPAFLAQLDSLFERVALKRYPLVILKD